MLRYARLLLSAVNSVSSVKNKPVVNEEADLAALHRMVAVATQAADGVARERCILQQEVDDLTEQVVEMLTRLRGYSEMAKRELVMRASALGFDEGDGGAVESAAGHACLQGTPMFADYGGVGGGGSMMVGPSRAIDFHTVTSHHPVRDSSGPGGVVPLSPTYGCEVSDRCNTSYCNDIPAVPSPLLQIAGVVLRASNDVWKWLPRLIIEHIIDYLPGIDALRLAAVRCTRCLTNQNRVASCRPTDSAVPLSTEFASVPQLACLAISTRICILSKMQLNCLANCLSPSCSPDLYPSTRYRGTQ